MRSLTISKNSIINRSKILDSYLTDIKHIPMLDEVELMSKIKSGDSKALNQLITQNLRFVVSVSKQFKTYNIPLEDMISAGNIGLIKAAHKFDIDRGFKFISYAVWWIRESILEEIHNQGIIVRLPLNVINSMRRLDNLIREKEQELAKELTYNEAIIMFDLDNVHKNSLLFESYGRGNLSLDFKYGEGDESHTLGDGEILIDNSFRQDFNYDTQESNNIVNSCIKQLDQQEQNVIARLMDKDIDNISISSINVKNKKNELATKKAYISAINKLKKSILLYDSFKKTSETPSIIKEEIIEEACVNLEEIIKEKKTIEYEDITTVLKDFILTPLDKTIITEMNNIVDGKKTSVAIVARNLNISKLDVLSAMKKHKKCNIY